MRLPRALVGLALLGLAGAPARGADDAEDPDLDFLEYLGSWQADDDEWVIEAEWENDAEPELDAKPEPQRAER